MIVNHVISYLEITVYQVVAYGDTIVHNESLPRHGRP